MGRGDLMHIVRIVESPAALRPVAVAIWGDNDPKR
jgi:hypothetical protein